MEYSDGGSPALAALERLGLTTLEAQAYAFLVRESPASGYRVAQALGKPFGSVYKAVEGLESKGAALLSEESGNRVARAVPIDELVARSTREFERSCKAASASLKAAKGREPDEHLYRLNSREQFFERARAMIAGAEDFVLGSITPQPAAELAPAFGDAAARVRVGLKVFGPLEVRGADIIPDHRGLSAIETGPGEWMMLTVDGREVLMGVFDAETGELNTGQWSENPLLTWSLFTGLGAQLVLAAVRTSDLAEAPRLVEIVERLGAFRTPKSVGKRMLVEKFRRPSRGRRGASAGGGSSGGTKKG
jgi:sugar-specific transcriptional regulator TrmB